jgi:hypothetical protein
MKRKDKGEFPVGFTINNHLSIRGESIGKIVIFRDMTNFENGSTGFFRETFVGYRP